MIRIINLSIHRVVLRFSHTSFPNLIIVEFVSTLSCVSTERWAKQHLSCQNEKIFNSSRSWSSHADASISVDWSHGVLIKIPQRYWRDQLPF